MASSTPTARAAACLLALLAATPAWPAETLVHNGSELRTAIDNAGAGDTITLADGVYIIREKLRALYAAPATSPIILRAAHPLAAQLIIRTEIGIEITGASWHLDGLLFQGDCDDDSTCEHAIHVVGPADNFQLLNSRLVNFNAHVKVNADTAHQMPARGLIENSEFFNAHPRHTDNPVAPLDIDNALDWIVRGNLVHDFQKQGGGEEAYGIFVKGGARAPLIERNLVECSSGAPGIGRMEGISLGAAGMTASQCPPFWSADAPCSPEVTGGIIRNNIIGNCSGDGIYLNKATASQILFNSLAGTAGLRARYPASTGLAAGNLLSGPIIQQDGASLTLQANISNLADAAAVAAWPRTPHASLSAPAITQDYCGRPRGAQADPGALQTSLGPCPLLHWAQPAKQP